VSPADISAEILRQTEALGPTKSICPSDVARALAPDNWRPLMTLIRQAAAALAGDGRLRILRKGKPVPPEEMRGVIRLSAPTRDSE